MQITSLDRSLSGCLIGLLLWANPLEGLGQSPVYENTSWPAEVSLESPPAEPVGLPPGVNLAPDEELTDKVGSAPAPDASEPTKGEGPASAAEAPLGYNLRHGDTSWLVGDGDDLGIVSLESFPALMPDQKWGIAGGLGFHFLGGPVRTDMPPRLFDFQIGIQRRTWLSDRLGYDLAARVGIFSDFEGSARQGVRFPAHAVGYYRCHEQLDVVFGIDYLDRDDVRWLPVAGVIVTPRDDLRLELVFPRPRAEFRITPTHDVYLAGELGGGTWAIERVTKTDDVVTYGDLRLLVGIESRDAEILQSGIEVGYVFSRDLSYRSGVGNYAPDDTLLIRFTQRY